MTSDWLLSGKVASDWLLSGKVASDWLLSENVASDWLLSEGMVEREVVVKAELLLEGEVMMVVVEKTGAVVTEVVEGVGVGGGVCGGR